MNRTVTVVEQSSQRKTVIENVEANTFGELRPYLVDAGINLENMDIREGVSKTSIINDATVLPHDIPWRGSTTNDLLLFLTLKNKKVASGMDRKEAVAYIKDNNLEEAVVEKFHDNYTRVSNANLISFVQEHQAASAKPTDAAASIDTCSPGKAVFALAEALYEEDYIDEDFFNKVKALVCGKLAPASNKGFSDEDIAELLDL